VPPLNLYARVRLLLPIARETAGAACIRHSLLPLSGRTKVKAWAGHAARSQTRIRVKPHHEEPRSGVSKDESHGRARWFETPAARAPHHEGGAPG
jgi:hypothetical protein